MVSARTSALMMLAGVVSRTTEAGDLPTTADQVPAILEISTENDKMAIENLNAEVVQIKKSLEALSKSGMLAVGKVFHPMGDRPMRVTASMQTADGLAVKARRVSDNSEILVTANQLLGSMMPMHDGLRMIAALTHVYAYNKDFLPKTPRLRTKLSIRC